MSHRPRLLASLAAAGLVCVAVAACSGPDARREIPDDAVVTPRDEILLASAKVALPPAMSVVDLPGPGLRGAEFVVMYCTACHSLPSPALHSRTDWPSVLRRMWLRAEGLPERFRVPVPGVAERITILEYMLDNALQVSAATLPDRPGRDLFLATCAQCHDVPDPRQHSPEDWVAVVRRMGGRMEEMLGRTLSGEDLSRIVLYLQETSRRT